MPEIDLLDPASSQSAILAWTAADFRKFMASGTFTSRHLVNLCLRQIENHNKDGMHLRALISVLNPSNALKVAEKLDQLRERGEILGPFHGIPIIVKDTINTSPYLHMPNTDEATAMRTTLGSPALLTSWPKGNAKIIDELVSQGAIILGKANLSEFGATKRSSKAIPGYSPVGGQTQSAYIETGVLPDDTILGNSNPGGSSSGSAVAVAAGFSPCSIGGETDGSLITPAARSSLYALKPTVDSVSGEGIFMLTKSLDGLGGMAKCVEDLTLLTETLLSTSDGPQMSDADLEKSFTNLAIGFLDPEIWKLPASLLEPSDSYTKQTLKQYKDAMDSMRNSGARVVFPVQLTPASEIKHEGRGGYSIVRNAEFRPQLDEYLKELDPPSSLAALIQYNIDHPDVAFSSESPDQSKLIAMQNDDTPAEFLAKAIPAIRKAAGPLNIDRVLKEHNLDIIIGPSDSPCTTVSAIAGYPIGTMPLGYLEESGRPFGLSVMGTAHAEATILAVMKSWEQLSTRKLPLPLLNWKSRI